MKYKPYKNYFWSEKRFFFKFMNNSIYGKTINARLVNNAKKYKVHKMSFWDKKEAK